MHIDECNCDDRRSKANGIKNIWQHWQRILVHAHTAHDRSARQNEHHFNEKKVDKKKTNETSWKCICSESSWLELFEGHFYQNCFETLWFFDENWLCETIDKNMCVKATVTAALRNEKCVSGRNTECVCLAHEHFIKEKCAQKMFCLDTVGPVILAHTQQTISIQNER